mmetsp:Transcript_14147/g.34482  ORF Transcript_14147/g.34482 Transcript_14147/m.34482 type:complete len:337 (-) Transcript_14147:396-1406(-)
MPKVVPFSELVAAAKLDGFLVQLCKAAKRKPGDDATDLLEKDGALEQMAESSGLKPGHRARLLRAAEVLRAKYKVEAGGKILRGSTHFDVETDEFEGLGGKVRLLVTPTEGIFFLNPETQEPVRKLPYPDIATWGYSQTTFILVAEKKITVRTAHGNEIVELLNVHAGSLFASKIPRPWTFKVCQSDIGALPQVHSLEIAESGVKLRHPDSPSNLFYEFTLNAISTYGFDKKRREFIFTATVSKENAKKLGLNPSRVDHSGFPEFRFEILENGSPFVIKYMLMLMIRKALDETQLSAERSSVTKGKETSLNESDDETIPTDGPKPRRSLTSPPRMI